MGRKWRILGAEEEGNYTWKMELGLVREETSGGLVGSREKINLR